MGTLTVRNLDDDVQQRIRVRAAEHGHSMEAEAREILTASVSGRDLIAALREIAVKHGGVDLELPARSMPREIHLK